MITPIENNGMLLRTQDYSAMKGNENRAAENLQGTIQSNIDKISENAAHQVVRKDDSDSSDTRHDAKEEGKNKYYNNRKKKDASVKKEGVMIAKDRGRFDMTI